MGGAGGGQDTMGLSGSSLLMAQTATFAGFAGLNIGLNFYNSWLLKPYQEEELVPNATQIPGTPTAYHYELFSPYHAVGAHPNFTFAVFYTMWHMVATTLGATVIMLTVAKPAEGFPNPKQFWNYKWALVAIALCTTANIGCNNVSLTLISLFLNQVIKATGPLPTMVFSVMFEGKKYGYGMVLSCAAIVAGTILSVPSSSSSVTTSLGGVIVVIVSTVAASLKPVVMSIVMKGTVERPRLAPTVVLFYDAFLSFWFMLVYWLASHERVSALEYLRSSSGGEAVGLIVGGASMAFMFNLSNYFFVKLTSALTTTVAANGVKVINIVISAIISGVSAPRNWVGVALVCLALCVYAFFSYQAKRRPPPKLWPPFSEYLPGAEDAEAGKVAKPTEATLLTKDGTGGGDVAKCCVIL